MCFEELADVEPAQHTKRIGDQLNPRPIGENGHFGIWRDSRDDSLGPVSVRELVSDGERPTRQHADLKRFCRLGDPAHSPGDRTGDVADVLSVEDPRDDLSGLHRTTII